MLAFRARERRKGHAYTNKGNPGALLGLLRRAKDGSTALPLSKMPALAVQNGAQAKGWGNPCKAGRRRKNCQLAPMFWGKAGALEAPRLWTHPEIPETLKRNYLQILQALNARESCIGETKTRGPHGSTV